MRSLAYKPGVRMLDLVSLSGDVYYAQEAKELRSMKWVRTLNAHSLTGVSRNAREISLPIHVHAPYDVNNMMSIFDAEMVLGKPGTLIIDNEWCQSVYVPETSTSKVHPTFYEQTWTIVLLDGAWHRDTVYPVHAVLAPVKIENTAKAYSYPYPYKYAVVTQNSVYPSNTLDSSMPVSFTIYGACSNPSITIGSNTYQIQTTVESDGYIVVDGLKHTVKQYSRLGVETNILDKAIISTGAGSGTYIFEELKPGSHAVSWNNTFNFDITVHELMSDPSWLTVL